MTFQQLQDFKQANNISDRGTQEFSITEIREMDDEPLRNLARQQHMHNQILEAKLQHSRGKQSHPTLQHTSETCARMQALSREWSHLIGEISTESTLAAKIEQDAQLELTACKLKLQVSIASKDKLTKDLTAAHAEVQQWKSGNGDVTKLNLQIKNLQERIDRRDHTIKMKSKELKIIQDARKEESDRYPDTLDWSNVNPDHYDSQGALPQVSVDSHHGRPIKEDTKINLL